jgi:hypothetical protein
MQDVVTQNALQPCTKLAQNNMVLFTQFCASPEVVARIMANAQSLFEQGRASATDLSQSKAAAQLVHKAGWPCSPRATPPWWRAPRMPSKAPSRATAPVAGRRARQAA